MLLTAIACLGGCFRHGDQKTVSGTVTVDGKPLAVGTINFRPAKARTGPSSGGAIQEGKFYISTTKGLQPGKYRVIVQAFRETGRIIHDMLKGDVPERVPIVFAQTMPLEAEVVADRKNHFEFRLTTTP